ncbi:MAG: winged helix-turn-helix domain-containing protein [Acidobacteriota bacterium]|nr:winged helix-turn-helix domain-containing protein [Acidobacteriota bacterium]
MWRFGVFEVDARRVELRRSGIPLKIREQSFRILLILLEHAGEIVTREELRQVLWPSDTFVDFDHSLNTAVMKLRDVLGDSAEAPIYIETIPKRGYRFVAPVTRASNVQRGPANRNVDSVSPSSGGSSEAAFGETPTDVGTTDSATHPVPQIDEMFWAHALRLEEIPDRAGAAGVGGRQAGVGRKRLLWGLLLGVGLLALVIAAAIWYLQRASN